MSCGSTINKMLGSDWKFFFKIQDVSGDLIDLNGFQYSYKIADEDGAIIKQDSGNINIAGNELSISIPAYETRLFSEGKKIIEVESVDTSGNTELTGDLIFYAVATLHSNS